MWESDLGAVVIPKVGAKAGAFPGPGQEGEYDVAGLGINISVDAACEIAHQVLEGIEAETGLSDAGHEHP